MSNWLFIPLVVVALVVLMSIVGTLQEKVGKDTAGGNVLTALGLVVVLGVVGGCSYKVGWPNQAALNPFDDKEPEISQSQFDAVGKTRLDTMQEVKDRFGSSLSNVEVEPPKKSQECIYYYERGAPSTFVPILRGASERAGYQLCFVGGTFAGKQSMNLVETTR